MMTRAIWLILAALTIVAAGGAFAVAGTLAAGGPV